MLDIKVTFQDENGRSGTGALNGWIKKKLDAFTLQAKADMEKCFDAAVQMTIGSIEGRLRNIYQLAAAGWYGSYSPVKYHRRRGLYNMLEVDGGFKTGSNSASVEYHFQDSYPAENGFELIDMVFIGGWHGGMGVFGKTQIQTRSAYLLFEDNKKALEEEWSQELSELTVALYEGMYKR